MSVNEVNRKHSVIPAQAGISIRRLRREILGSSPRMTR